MEDGGPVNIALTRTITRSVHYANEAALNAGLANSDFN